MAAESGEGKPPSSEFEQWEWEETEKVAARFPATYRKDLQAELALTLLALKRDPPAGIRD